MRHGVVGRLNWMQTKILLSLGGVGQRFQEVGTARRSECAQQVGGRWQSSESCVSLVCHISAPGRAAGRTSCSSATGNHGASIRNLGIANFNGASPTSSLVARRAGSSCRPHNVALCPSPILTARAACGVLSRSRRGLLARSCGRGRALSPSCSLSFSARVSTPRLARGPPPRTT